MLEPKIKIAFFFLKRQPYTIFARAINNNIII